MVGVVEAGATIEQLFKIFHLSSYARVCVKVQVSLVKRHHSDLLNLKDSGPSDPGDRPLAIGLDEHQKVVAADIDNANYAKCVVVGALVLLAVRSF